LNIPFVLCSFNAFSPFGKKNRERFAAVKRAVRKGIVILENYVGSFAIVIFNNPVIFNSSAEFGNCIGGIYNAIKK
jgi:hypothetical protein